MREALKDYNEMVLGSSWKWLRKHWKGYTVLLVVLMTVPYLWFYRSDIVESIKSEPEKKKTEEEP